MSLLIHVHNTLDTVVVTAVIGALNSISYPNKRNKLLTGVVVGAAEEDLQNKQQNRHLVMKIEQM